MEGWRDGKAAERVGSNTPTLQYSITPFRYHYFASALAVCAPCFLNTRVGENSPSRWPTMFSVTNTGLKTFPLCTVNVRPTKSGVIVERRDHVLMGALEFDAFALTILSI